MKWEDVERLVRTMDVIIDQYDQEIANIKQYRQIAVEERDKLLQKYNAQEEK